MKITESSEHLQLDPIEFNGQGKNQIPIYYSELSSHNFFDDPIKITPVSESIKNFIITEFAKL